MNLIKNFRLIGFITLVLISSFIILYSEISKSSGVVVTYVGAATPCKEIINVGSVITEVAGIQIRDSSDFNRVTKGVKGITTFMIDDNPRSCDIPENSSLDVTVENIKKGGLNLGIDIGGGTIYSFKFENDDSQKILETIKSRTKYYDLANTRVELSDSTIQIITSLEEEKYVRFLTENGIIEGNLILKIQKDEFVLNDKTYKLILKDEKSVSINDTEFKPGQYVTIDNVKVKIENISKNVTTLSLNIFDEGDLTLATGSTNTRRLVKQGNGYAFVVPVLLSKEAGENFAKVTKGQEVIIDPTSGQSYLKNSLVVLVDDQEFINLPISGQDAGKELKELVIWGYKVRKGDATNNMIRLSTLIETKRLETDLNFEKSDSYKAKTGDIFIISLLFTILAATITTSFLFLVKYRKRGIIILPLILISLSEFLLILGIVSFGWFVFFVFFIATVLVLIKGDIRNWIHWLTIFLMFIIVIGITMSKWVLGIPSLIGLMLVFLISIGQGVFMSYQILKKRETYTVTDYKLSMDKFWLFTTVVTTIFFVLFLIGGQYREFAMTTSLGLFIATTITTPAYSSIIEKVIK